MNRYLIKILALVLYCSQAHAEQAISEYVLRIGTSAGFEAIEFNNGVEDDSMAGLAFGASVVYQSPVGFYGHLGYTKYGMSSLRAFDEGISGINEKESERLAGMGFRFQFKDRDGIYLGLGYSKSEIEWEYSSNSFDSGRLFLQKERERRYGVISISHNEGDNLRSLSLEGSYIWFFGRSDWGMGLSWAIGEGKYKAMPEDLDMKQRAIGVAFMYRPKFGE